MFFVVVVGWGMLFFIFCGCLLGWDLFLCLQDWYFCVFISVLYLFPSSFQTLVPPKTQKFLSNAYFSFNLGLPYKMYPLNWIYFFAVFYLVTKSFLLAFLFSLGFVIIIATIGAVIVPPALF